MQVFQEVAKAQGFQHKKEGHERVVNEFLQGWQGRRIDGAVTDTLICKVFFQCGVDGIGGVQFETTSDAVSLRIGWINDERDDAPGWIVEGLEVNATLPLLEITAENISDAFRRCIGHQDIRSEDPRFG